MIPTLAGAALAGLVGSPHCVGMCGGLATAAGGRLRDVGAWSLGRLTTYALLGAVAGGTAGALPIPRGVGLALAAILLVWFAASLADLPVPKLPVPPALHRLGARLLGRRDPLSRFAFGMVNGLLPCGLVYAALALPVAAGDPVVGALAMVAFGLGTVPALAVAAAGLRRLVAGSLWRRRVLAALVLLVGLGTMIDRSHLALPDGPATAAPQEVE
ncbi:MAG: sulfite exporter TauE/SafE family protein [Alphaproteobacteria bacterium]|nr:sulfite exporter TauE/SafE family protein [Alphaproteobacteria bacterium]